jgi:hypothetical protein
MQGRLPRDIRIRKRVLTHHRIEELSDEVFLVGDMVVERHRLDAEILAEPAHGERLDPVLIGERHGGGDHPRPGQRSAPLLARLGSGGGHELGIPN